MKKIGYLLSVALHALLLLAVLNSRFPITIRPEPPRVVVVRIAEPFPSYGSEGVPAGILPGDRSPAPAGGIAGSGAAAGGAPGVSAGPASSRSALSFPASGKLSLRNPPGSFRLAPVGKSPDPWAVPFGPGPPPRPLRYSVGAYRPGAAPGGNGGPGNVFLLPFDIRERAVADWTEAALSRIERNWFIPTSARLAFSGQVQITLTIERQGRQRALVIDHSNVPEPLTLAALHAVQAVLPLPPLPENVAGESFAFTFVFSYNG